MNLSKNANKIMEYMKKRYIESGYLYSGNVTPDEIQELLKMEFKNFRMFIDELKEVGLIQIRNCEGFALEFTKDIRKQLIQENNLSEIWEEIGSCFYPNGTYGEVTRVMT